MDELVRHDWSAKSLQVLNPVRLYLGVTLLSQCCNAAGTHIHPDIWQCKRNTNVLRSPLWPNFKVPTPSAIRAWQSMLTDVFILGLWKSLDNAEWVWWLDPTSGDVFERHPHLAWWKWRALPMHHQQRRFSLDGPTLDSPPPTSVRVSIRVTGRTLRLLTEGLVAPQVGRPPPATLCEALEFLPRSCHWAVQHAEITDEGRAIAAAIRSGAAVAVSDGSLRYTLGTSAFVIEGMDSAHRIVGYSRVPGPIKEGDSHRCELAGLYAIVTLVNCLCHHHRITQGSILVACDNTGALKPGAVDFLPKCSQKNLDLLQAIWKSIQESPIEWTTQHVYGHQDQKAKDSHHPLPLSTVKWMHLPSSTGPASMPKYSLPLLPTSRFTMKGGTRRHQSEISSLVGVSG